MNLRPLGTTGLQVSPVGFGCWQLGGEGWGAFSARDVQAAIARALELGVNLFDTAPVYGFGQSEELLGRTLASVQGSEVIVSKAGLVWDDRKSVRHDNRPESLKAQVEGTLRRLRRDTLDVLLLHWPDPAVSLDASLAGLETLRTAGKIRAWGLSNFPALEVLHAAPGVEVVEYPRNALSVHAKEFQEAARAGNELLAGTREPGRGFVAYDVLARGLLGGRHGRGARFGKRDVRSRDERFTAAQLPRNLERAERLFALAARIGAPPAALAVRAVLEEPGVTSCLVGMKTIAQLEEIAQAVSLRLTVEVGEALKEIQHA